ncbi:MAG: prepilin-type N-terminal cleavage/methylation domain-containing protein [Phycisphaerales bacterium]|nr:MAG: prepilin-type N-terminal cleavage/methylation domain-containing protein [Phycisphaerales bacterium]
MGTKCASGARSRRRGFSLVELVIVVTIIGIIASIAVPRMTSATSNAEANALQATLANVRKVIDVYYAEHGKYPGYTPGTNTPSNDRFVDQLLLYSDEAGNTNAAPTAVFRYGPYLRSPFPRNPRNQLDTVYVKATPGDANPADGAFGWSAVLSHGYFGVSLSDADLVDIGIDDAKMRDAVKGESLDVN